MKNFFKNIPESLPEELLEEIFHHPKLRIERIISDGHSSPESFWYDQEENEWLVLLEGSGVIEYENNELVPLSRGESHFIPAGKKHRVAQTSLSEKTIWLAIFFSE